MRDDDYLEEFGRALWEELGKSRGGVENLTPLQRAAVALMNFQAEVNNGGIHQFLYNSSGQFARELPLIMRQIGAEPAARIMDEANQLFGPDGPPADRKQRIDILLSLPRNAVNRLEALTNEFYDAEDNGMMLADLFDAFVLANRTDAST